LVLPPRVELGRPKTRGFKPLAYYLFRHGSFWRKKRDSNPRIKLFISSMPFQDITINLSDTLPFLVPLPRVELGRPKTIVSKTIAFYLFRHRGFWRIWRDSNSQCFLHTVVFKTTALPLDYISIILNWYSHPESNWDVRRPEVLSLLRTTYFAMGAFGGGYRIRTYACFTMSTISSRAHYHSDKPPLVL